MTLRIQSLDNLQECCKNRTMNLFANIILQFISKLSSGRRVNAARFKSQSGIFLEIHNLSKVKQYNV